MRTIMQSWTQELGLRHQGVLLTAVRGCDVVPKEDVSKRIVRHLRSTFMNAHCGDPKKAVSFIEIMDEDTFFEVCRQFAGSLDHYPLHYVAHLMHTAEIIGYYHPDMEERCFWNWFYETIVNKLHLRPETKDELDARLNVDESTMAFLQTNPWHKQVDGSISCTAHKTNWLSNQDDGCYRCIKDGMRAREVVVE